MQILQTISQLVQKHLEKKRTPSPPPMKKTFLLALGNPGKKYQNTRHNLGQMALDYFAREHGCAEWKEHHKAAVMLTELQQEGHKIYLVKPLSYMNDSGKPVRALLDFYKASPDDVILIHDELDLPAGDIRITPEASAGGHNGLKSVFNYLNTQSIRRIRLGIKNKKLDKIPTDKFVLQPFGLLERRKIEKQLPLYSEAIACMMNDSTETCMNQFN